MRKDGTTAKPTTDASGFRVAGGPPTHESNRQKEAVSSTKRKDVTWTVNSPFVSPTPPTTPFTHSQPAESTSLPANRGQSRLSLLTRLKTITHLSKPSLTRTHTEVPASRRPLSSIRDESTQRAIERVKTSTSRKKQKKKSSPMPSPPALLAGPEEGTWDGLEWSSSRVDQVQDANVEQVVADLKRGLQQHVGEVKADVQEGKHHPRRHNSEATQMLSYIGTPKTPKTPIHRQQTNIPETPPREHHFVDDPPPRGPSHPRYHPHTHPVSQSRLDYPVPLTSKFTFEEVPSSETYLKRKRQEPLFLDTDKKPSHVSPVIRPRTRQSRNSRALYHLNSDTDEYEIPMPPPGQQQRFHSSYPSTQCDSSKIRSLHSNTHDSRELAQYPSPAQISVPSSQDVHSLSHGRPVLGMATSEPHVEQSKPSSHKKVKTYSKRVPRTYVNPRDPKRAHSQLDDGITYRYETHKRSRQGDRRDPLDEITGWNDGYSDQSDLTHKQKNRHAVWPPERSKRLLRGGGADQPRRKAVGLVPLSERFAYRHGNRVPSPVVSDKGEIPRHNHEQSRLQKRPESPVGGVRLAMTKHDSMSHHYNQ